MDKFETLEKTMCKELEALEHKIQGNVEMSVQDLEKIDKLAHAMKSLATYKAMKEAEEYEGEMSGRRGRAMNSRYVSRDGGGYSEGYSQGYSEAMRQSGYHPMMYPPDRLRY